MDKKTSVETIDQYISGFPLRTQEILQEMRRIIHEEAPDAKEKISYQMPTFDLFGNLVHFAAYEHHIGFYPTPSGIEAFSEEIAGYKSAKGSVQFPIDEPLPIDLISRMVRFRVAENRMKESERKEKKGKKKC